MESTVELKGALVAPAPAAEPAGRIVLLRIVLMALALRAVLWLDGIAVDRFAGGHDLIRFWSRWDAPHYMSIVRHGYVRYGVRRLWLVFPPGYPYLVKGVTIAARNPIAAGLLVSFLASVGAGWFLYKLTLLDAPHTEAWRATVLLFCFPTAYFMAAPYAESLFLLAILGSMYAARTDRWGRAGLMGAVATVTRLSGVAFIPALAVEALASPYRRMRKLAWAAVSGTGIFAFVLANWIVHRDPLEFLKYERGAPWFQRAVPPWDSLLDAVLQIAHVTHPRTSAYWVLTLRLVATAIVVYLLVLGHRRLRPAERVYAWGSLAFCLSASRIISLPRYVLPIYPILIVMANRSKSRTVFIALVAFGLAAQIIFFARYSQSMWAF